MGAGHGGIDEGRGWPQSTHADCCSLRNQGLCISAGRYPVPEPPARACLEGQPPRTDPDVPPLIAFPILTQDHLSTPNPTLQPGVGVQRRGQHPLRALPARPLLRVDRPHPQAGDAAGGEQGARTSPHRSAPAHFIPPVRKPLTSCPGSQIVLSQSMLHAGAQRARPPPPPPGRWRLPPSSPLPSCTPSPGRTPAPTSRTCRWAPKGSGSAGCSPTNTWLGGDGGTGELMKQEPMQVQWHRTMRGKVRCERQSQLCRRALPPCAAPRAYRSTITMCA